jgi:hypothetical protein
MGTIAQALLHRHGGQIVQHRLDALERHIIAGDDQRRAACGSVSISTCTLRLAGLGGDRTRMPRVAMPLSVRLMASRLLPTTR